MQRVNKKNSPKINSHNLASFWMCYRNKQNQKSNTNSHTLSIALYNVRFQQRSNTNEKKIK